MKIKILVGQLMIFAMALVDPITPTGAAIATQAPIVRPTGFTPQTSSCYIEMPNQSRQNLDGLCQVGKPQPKQMIDLSTDRDGDGVPDELAAEFRKLDALMSRRTYSRADSATQQRLMSQQFMAMNERLPYAASTKAAMREMMNIMYSETNRPPGGKSDWQRMDQLRQQLNRDPMYRQFDAYAARFHQNKWASRGNR